MTDAQGRALQRTAAAIAVVATLCCLATVGYHHWLDARAEVPRLFWSDLVLGSVWPIAGAIVVWAQPRNAVGWVMLIPATLGPYQLLAHYAAAAQLVPGAPVAGADAAAWVGMWGFASYFFVIPLLLLLFPDGHPASPRWRVVVGLVLAAAAVTTVARSLSPVALDVAPQVGNPYGISAAPWLRYVTLVGAFLTLIGGSIAGLVAVAARLRRATGLQRSQLLWLVMGGLVLVLCLVVGVVANDTSWLSDGLFTLGLLGPPVAIAVAMVRHQLFDVEFAVNRTLVLSVLTVLVVGVYAVVVLAIGQVAAGSPAGLVAVAAAALVASAARSSVQRWVDRLLFGHRRDPYAVLTRVERQVAAASEPVEALQRLVDGLRAALRLPYAAFVGEVQVVSGTPRAGWDVVPANALGQPVGELHVGLRSRGEQLSDDERGAVEEVAARAGTLAYAARLVADVSESRARIVAAREEERRRLRADLHDGVGPVLAGSAHQLDALARRLEAEGQTEHAARARELRDRLRGTVADVRHAVHGLRPPVLDQLGLAGALRDLVAGFDVPACRAEVPDDLGTLPAAVEVNAYAIAAEAVTNAVRHSAASRLSLGAQLREGTLVVEVVDNGRGVPKGGRSGVGLRSMSERASEVGGRLEVVAAEGGGTVVRAALPVGAA